MNATRDTFGPLLKCEREKRGLTLDEISTSTKIKASLLEDLEQGDFSKWPGGIFTRAHLCDYVSAIGLPPQPVLAEYLRLFPERDLVEPPCPPKTEPADGGAAGDRHAPLSMASRVWAVFFDLSAILLVASVVAATGAISLPWATAAAAVSFSAIGIACFSESIGARVQRSLRARMERSLDLERQEKAIAELKVIAQLRESGSADRRETDAERDLHRRASA